MTSIPQKCMVLVVGGGPAGSYASAALAREGIDVVLLEAEKFPRYHVGESMLPSMRHFLKFIDGYEKWDAHGFNVKVTDAEWQNGGAFRLNWSRPETYTDFIAAGGKGGYAWNVIRSEADDLLFQHATECGVKTFDATKVTSIEFHSQGQDQGREQEGCTGPRSLGRPVAATWSRKDGSTGTIDIEYLVDASGRAGLVSTKYLKNRHFNQGLKNVASWGYWKGGGVHGVGTHKEGAPYFEALKDASGWAWFIPLHNGTHSVGIVQNQEMANQKKRAMAEPSTQRFYQQSLDLVPGIRELLAHAELVSDIKSASDWSYSASCYAFPGVRVVGDAGSFIDPFFSSGVHLALSGGLSAAVTIAAAIRGDCDEGTAASWHDKKTAESYTRFLVVVSSALKQIRASDQPVLHDFDEESFERAFDLFRPVIQGQVDSDVKGSLTQAEISKTLEFCFKAFAHVSFEDKEALVQKLKTLGLDGDAYDASNRQALAELEKKLTPEEQAILQTLKGRRMVRSEDSLNIDNFTLDSIDGLAPRLERGKLGLVAAKKAAVKFTTSDRLSYLNGEARAANRLGQNGHADPDGSPAPDEHTSANVQHGEVNGRDDVKRQSNYACRLTELLASAKPPAPTSLDEFTRHHLMSSLHESAEELETPFDTMARLANAGRQVALVQLGGDLGIFQSLVESQTPLSSAQLAGPRMADPALVARIARYLAANRLVGEAGPDRYVARRATHALADPRIASPMRFFHAVSNPSYQALPDHLRETGYRNQGAAGSALRKGLLLGAEQGGSSPGSSSTRTWRATSRTSWAPRANPTHGPSFRSTHPSAPPTGGPDARRHRRQRRPTGAAGSGPESRAGRARGGAGPRGDCPECPRGEGGPANGARFLQAAARAKYYYLRAILHNWDEDQAVQILANIVPAMSAESLVLIDEVVLPEEGAHVWPAGLDLQMLTLFGGGERTAPEWDCILERAGLRPVAVKKYAPVMESCVIFATRK
ncbi:tryptophan halogenase domain-containing protein [Apiospora sp. TS-2023a]